MAAAPVWPARRPGPRSRAPGSKPAGPRVAAPPAAPAARARPAAPGRGRPQHDGRRRRCGPGRSRRPRRAMRRASCDRAPRVEGERTDGHRLIRAAPRKPTDVRCLELAQVAVTHLHEAAARQVARNPRGTIAADHVGALPCVVDAQGDPQIGVRTDVGADDASGPLRREDQVNAQAPPALRNIDHAGDELGDFLRQGRELVDHDQEARRRPAQVARLHVGKIFRPGLAQYRLPPPQLGVQRDQRTVGQVLVEVGDEADRMGQLHACSPERRAALVIDQQERHTRRRVARGERGNDRLQQLALAGPGGARNQRVRPPSRRSTDSASSSPTPIGPPTPVACAQVAATWRASAAPPISSSRSTRRGIWVRPRPALTSRTGASAGSATSVATSDRHPVR